MTLYDAIGLLAPLFFMTAYIMTAIGKWDGNMVRLHACNLAGAVTMMVSLMHAWNLPMVVMEICWGAVATYGLYRTVRVYLKA